MLSASDDWRTSSIIEPRQSIAELTGQWSAVWSRPWDAIANLEIIPGCKVEDDEWFLPIHWVPQGSRAIGYRRMDFRKASPTHWSPDDMRGIASKRRVKRIAILLATRPLKIGRQVLKPNRPITWAGMVRCLIEAARFAIVEEQDGNVGSTRCPDDEVRIFSGLTPECMERLKAKRRQIGHTLIPRLNALFADGSFDDWPADDVTRFVYDSDPFRPFADDFTAEIARAALWFSQTLGPDILTCWEDVQGISKAPDGSLRPRDVKRFRLKHLEEWSGRQVSPGFSFDYGITIPYQPAVGAGCKIKVQRSWPPPSLRSVKIMISLLQSAHMIIILLCTAMRDGELISLDYNCIMPVGNDFALSGKTYKLANGPSGEDRYWPLPKLAVAVLKQQQRLHSVVGGPIGKLWCSFSPVATDGQKGPSGPAIKFFARKLVLPNGRSLESLCSGNIHPHRFRKTVVRLTALSLIGANQILVDILGHDDPEMTLGYILSDPDIQADLEKVRQEASHALAKEAVQHAQSNGGPAAPAVRSLVRRMLADRATPEQEEMRIERAAAILGGNGNVAFVRKGVICTKTFEQPAPCTQRVGSPDPGRCRADCFHRLELEAAKADHRASIEQILDVIPVQAGFERTFWQGQLLAHLSPFVDLKAEMLKRESVRSALSGGIGDQLLLSKLDGEG